MASDGGFLEAYPHWAPGRRQRGCLPSRILGFGVGERRQHDEGVGLGDRRDGAYSQRSHETHHRLRVRFQGKEPRYVLLRFCGSRSNARLMFILIVSCAYDLFIKLWNVENDYQNFATLRGHEHSVSSAKFLPGDDRIISSSRDQTVRIWEIATTYVHREACCMRLTQLFIQTLY